MQHRNSTIRIPHVFALIFACFSIVSASAWEEITHGGTKYVTARSIKQFYGFTKFHKVGSKLTLENKSVAMQIRENSQECIMNTVKFVLSYPVVHKSGRTLVSQTDLIKLIDPVLRPNYIKEAQGFRTVILDPGHGGKDPGAVNQYGHESKYALKVSLMVRNLLKAKGFNVIMTRSTDKFLSLTQRVALANRYKNAVFVSIHFNSGGAGKARGIETFTLSPKGIAHYGRTKRSSDNRSRPGNAQDSSNIALATAVHGSSLRRVGVPDRGIKRARFSVLSTIKHPAILVEGGFLSHAYEARQIHNSNYQRSLATGIAEGIMKFRVATTPR